MLEDMDKLVSLCKRRGFIFPSSEVYGGINGFWDYGPMGVELKRNIKDAWWADNVRMRDDMVGLDCSIIMNPRVWEASGHVGGFSDPMVDCRATKERYRADQMFVFAYVFPKVNHKGEPTEAWLAGLGNSQEEAAEAVEKCAAKLAKKFGEATQAPTVIPYLQLSQEDREKVIGPATDERGTLTEPRAFNLMFKTFVGALESESNVAYLRPETAQGIFANFKNVVDTGRVKLPFGIAQVGKSFRNEINPRNFTFRSREFEQMEIEFFCRPEEAAEWYAYWRKARFQWYVDLGLQSDQLRLRDHDPEELAFYSTATADIEYTFPFGTSELEGIAHRGDYDLKQHIKFSGKDLSYFDEDKKERFVPHVIEPSAGADRATLAFLCEAYTDDQVGGEARTVLKFHPRIAPVKAAVFPLVKRDGMPEKAEAIYREMKRRFNVFYDEKGAIGRRYRRQDEAGTPFCVTVDSQTLTDGTVTFRDRDTCRQWRVPGEGAGPGAGRPLARPADPGWVLSQPFGCSPSTVPRAMSNPVHSVHFTRAVNVMKACISQVSTLMNPFESDAASYRSGGWDTVELWLTKLEAYVQDHTAAAARSLFDAAGVRPVAAAGQGGLLLSQVAAYEAHWGHFHQRLVLLRELGVSTIIVAADSAANVGRTTDVEDFARAAAALGKAAELAGSFGVRIALEFQKDSPICASLETAVALALQCGSRNAGVCLDVFHFQTGPSKLEDLDGLPAELIAWVQLSDVSSTPRELAGDADRILPGDGDFPLAAIVERLARTGYDGYVSLELLNPNLWRIPADRVTDMGHRALRRVLAPVLAEPETELVASADGPPASREREGGT